MRRELCARPPTFIEMAELARRMRILFVEDEPSISEPFSKALVREGFEPVTARSAREALALADRMEPDLVLLDLGLPDADGRDLCRELRRSSSVPIVMLTARGAEMDRVVGLELGADDYVVKPFSGPEVVATDSSCAAARRRAQERTGRARRRARGGHAGQTSDTRRRGAGARPEGV